MATRLLIFLKQISFFEHKVLKIFIFLWQHFKNAWEALVVPGAVVGNH